LRHADIIRIENSANMNQLANILNKYISVHIKRDIDVIEFRIFSMLGMDIDATTLHYRL
jgi:hypothetical protein